MRPDTVGPETVRPAGNWARDARAWALALALAIATTWIYSAALGFEFVEYDDALYVTKNEMVLRGLNRETVAWAFTTDHDANRIPLTWLSHLLDVELYGEDPAGHHATSLALHVVDTLLLFSFFLSATGRLARSALVAALFALHPLHVESVAWVAERKDVLSTFFALLGLHAYLRYARRPGAGRMALVVLLFALGLASKSMVVSFPFLLLLLDVWPLGRIDLRSWRREDRGVVTRLSISFWWRRWIEHSRSPRWITLPLLSPKI